MALSQKADIKEPVAKIKSGLYDKASDSFFYPPEIE